MKTIILAGGFGTRIPEYTKKIPKPMIKIGGVPLLTHIMRIYTSFGFNEFIIATGYKKELIKKHYLKSKEFTNLKIIDTGKKTMTGGRIKKLKKFIKKGENFFLTYGDGLSNINLNKLLEFHLKHKKIATVTAVRPPVRFGEMTIKNSKVISFNEKPETKSSWINGGFFVLNYKVFKYIKNDLTSFEKEPIKKLTHNKNLMAFKHIGFWKCMDNLGDKNYLEKLYKINRSYL
ncbi:sugar phosphate nucleotidyltransferase [Candidatus Pelagibacter sp.]|nr:sugar phosphate nucleotidyltransferase [Candidatus Pelagibacter sp.]